MKKSTILNLLMGLFAMFFLANCGDDSEDSSPTLSVQPTSITLGADGTERAVNVSSNTSWTVRSDDSWLQCSPTGGTGGGVVTIRASVNTGEARYTKLTFTDKTGRATASVNVTQEAGSNPQPPTPEKTLEISKNSVSFMATGRNDSFTIQSNTSWTVSSDKDWCTVSPTSGSNDGTVTVSAKDNTETSSRTATITVKAGDITKTITVTQEATTPSSVEMSLKDMLERPFGTLDIEFRTATYSKLKTVLSNLYVFEEKLDPNDNNRPYFYIFEKDNPTFKNFSFLGISLSSLCIRDKDKSFYVEYNIDIEKINAPNPYTYIENIINEYNKINIPMTLELDPYPEYPQELASGYYNIGGHEAGGISYWTTLISWDDSTSYRYEIGASFYIK